MHRKIKVINEKFPPNVQQLFNTIFFLIVGKFVVRLDFAWSEFFVACLVALVTEITGSYLRGYKRNLISYATPFITAIAVTLILRTTNLWILALVVFLGIAQKFLLQVDKKAFQNPSNFAVLSALLFFPGSSYLELSEWGHIWWVNTAIFFLGFVLLFRVKFLWNTLFFVFLVVAGHLLYISTSPVYIWHRLTSTTFLLYILFIINDPKAIPATRPYQALNVAIIFSIYFFPMLYWTEREILLPLSVFLSSLLVPLYRRLETRNFPFPFLAAIAGLLFLALSISFYFSDRNLRRGLAIEPEAPLKKIGFVAPQQKPRTLSKHEFRQLFQNPLRRAYKRHWNSSHIERIPLQKNKAALPKLQQLANTVSLSPPAFQPDYSGFDLAPYAAIASGDINQDGRLDLLLAWPYDRLRVYINRGKNHFSEVSRYLFAQVPRDMEQAAFVDLNGDSHLDLLLVYSGYRRGAGTEIFIFDPKRYMFFPKAFYPTKALSSGGVSFVDLNQDRIPDFYISYGVNWQSPRPNFKTADSYIDEFFVSTKGGRWQEALAQVFPPSLATQPFISMTPLFSDIDKDGDPDFLLGADFRDPSVIFLRERKKYRLLKNESIEKNTRHSMSYFPLDVDNDGSLELWENGISITEKSSLSEVRQMTEKSLHIPQSQYHREMVEIIRKFSRGGSNCKEYSHPWSKEECRDLYYTIKAITTNKKEFCDKILNKARRYSCVQDLFQMTQSDERLFKTNRFDPSVHVKQTEVNVLLRYDPSRKKYVDIIKSNIQYTGWSWAAFPFDINNDGFLDLYITNGYYSSSHNTNRLFLHKGGASAVQFENKAPELRVDFEDESRGLIIQDLDGDGDGEIVINNAATAPIYLKNNFGGQAIEVELRSQKDNYYGLGASIELVTGRGIQTRELTLGGIWNSYPALRAHFAIPKKSKRKGSKERALELRIRWPDGYRQVLSGIRPGNLHIIYR